VTQLISYNNGNKVDRMNEEKDKQDSENNDLSSQFVAGTSISTILAVFEKLISCLSLEVNAPVKIYTISEVAKFLKCKERAVKHHLYEKRNLKYLLIGREVRIRDVDLIDFVNNHLTL
jgi:hypothetical protein